MHEAIYLHAMLGWENQHFNICQASIFIVIIKHTYIASLAKPVSKVKILVMPWPDLPGWFPSLACTQCMAIYILTYNIDSTNKSKC